MMTGHLSDEAVAAFADGVLSGHARTRATRHTAECAECAHAVRVQREAAFALRAAPAPCLPTALLDRLRGLPQVTPIRTPPTVLMPDGSTMLSTLGPVAAFVPSTTPSPAGDTAAKDVPTRDHHRPGPFATTAAVVVLAGALAAGAMASGTDDAAQPGTGNTVPTVGQRTDPGGADTGVRPVSAWLRTDVFHTGGR